jgi:hypothetical protein
MNKSHNFFIYYKFAYNNKLSTFKKSDKATHKLYSTSNDRKEFVTNLEFALENSASSVDLNPSFSELQDSFFSRDSSKLDNEILEQLKESEKPIKQHSLLKDKDEEMADVKRNKEESNYTTKPIVVKLEHEEFRKSWLCQACIANEGESGRRHCDIF